MASLFEEMGDGSFTCEERKSDAYNYVRVFTSNSGSFSQTKVLEMKIQDFSQVYLPPGQSAMYLKLFSSETQNGEPLPMHQMPGADEKCMSICITTTSVPPYQLKPLKYETNVKRKTQHIILELGSLEAFLRNLPTFVNDVIPWMESSTNGTSEVKNLSPYSTYRTRKQLRSIKTLKTFPEAGNACLEMQAIMFENSNSINLRYRMGDESKSGVYFPMELCKFLLEEREPLQEVIYNVKATSQWKEISMERDGLLYDEDMAALKRSGEGLEDGVGGSAAKRLKIDEGRDEVNTQRV